MRENGNIEEKDHHGGGGHSIRVHAGIRDPGIHPSGGASVRRFYGHRHFDRRYRFSVWRELFRFSGNARSEHSGGGSVQPQHQQTVYLLFIDAGIFRQFFSESLPVSAAV